MCRRKFYRMWTLLIAGMLLWSNLWGSEPLVGQESLAWREQFRVRPGGRVSRILGRNQAHRSTSPASDKTDALIQRLPPVEIWQPKPLQQAVQPVVYNEEISNEPGDSNIGLEGSDPDPSDGLPALELESYEAPAKLNEDAPMPIDLANALAMGGASHVEIQLARQRLIEAHAGFTEARALWLPSFRFGVGWTKHDGRLQETEGNILEVSRGAFFLGGGAGLGGVPLAGAAGGPMRLMVNLSLSDAIFAKRSAGWVVQAACADQVATKNRVLLDIAVAYFDLLESHGLLANAQVGYNAAEELLELTATFQQAGIGTQTEVDRAEAELAAWRQNVEDARRLTVGRSANLVRLLRLKQQGILVPTEEKVTPLDLVDPDTPVEILTSEALNNRPELAQLHAFVQAAAFQTRQEHLRPWLPHLQAGASSGMMAGGTGSTFENDGGRSDFDLLAVWELRNAGLGNQAAFRRRRAQWSQTRLQLEWLRDQITADIATNAGDVASFQNQIEMALDRVVASGKSFDLNRERIAEGEGIPIELVQAIRVRVEALDAHTKTVANYNRAQYRLLQSLGRSTADPSDP